MSGKITMTAIARRLGLGQATVSHVLNGRGEELGISPATQQRIRQAVKELGYRPNALARAMRSGRLGQVALLASPCGADGQGDLAYPLAAALAKARLSLVLAVANDNDAPTEGPRAWREGLADALVVDVRCEDGQRLAGHVRSASVPCVWVGLDESSDCVSFDELPALTQAIAALRNRGHKRIALVDHTASPSPLRQKAYEEAMSLAQLSPRTIRPEAHATRSDLLADAQGWLFRPGRPSAVIVAGDVGIVQVAALSMGLTIPGDLAIVSIDTGVPGRLGPDLATLVQAPADLADAAAEMVRAKLKSPQTPCPSQRLPVRFLPGPHLRTPGPTAS